MKITHALFAATAALALYACADEPPRPTMYPIMIDQHGNISPNGYVAGLTDIANEEARAAANLQAGQVVQQATAAASNVVDAIATALTGSIGFGYVTGHVISFSGTVDISTNATSNMLLLQLGQGGSMTTNGVPYSGHYVWHAYNVPMNSLPAIKYMTNLDATNAWEFVQYQSTAEFNDIEINGITFPTLYRSTVWMPTALSGAFFIAFVESYGGGQAGGFFDVQGGFTIGGKRGLTGTLVEDGLLKTFEGGAFMSYTNEVPQ